MLADFKESCLSVVAFSGAFYLQTSTYLEFKNFNKNTQKCPEEITVKGNAKRLDIRQILQMIIVKKGQDPVEKSHDQRKPQIQTNIKIAAKENHPVRAVLRHAVVRAAQVVKILEVNHEQIIQAGLLQFIRKSQNQYKKNVSLLIDSVIP